MRRDETWRLQLEIYKFHTSSLMFTLKKEKSSTLDLQSLVNYDILMSRKNFESYVSLNYLLVFCCIDYILSSICFKCLQTEEKRIIV